MKKIFAILLAIFMLVSLVACDEEEPKKTDPPANVFDPSDLGSIISGTSSVVWSEQSAATKQAIIDAAKAEGVDITFGADGSMTVSDPESNTTMVQKPDGTWTIKGENGFEGQLGGNWPDNEFTRLIPKPDFPILAAVAEDDNFAVSFQDATIEQIRAYVDQVKSKGFTVDAETTDESMFGATSYVYTAKNAQCYTISVTYAFGVSGISVTKPEAE